MQADFNRFNCKGLSRLCRFYIRPPVGANVLKCNSDPSCPVSTHTFCLFAQKPSDMDEYQKYLVDSTKEASDTSIPEVHCREKAGKVKISKDTLKLIKEKRKLRRQYAKQKLPSTKSSINKLQKEINQKLNKETNTRWGKFCISVILEKDPTKSWCGIKNFLKPKTQKIYPTLTLHNKTAKTNADKAEPFAESMERHFGIECNNFNDTNLREINQFVEANPYIFTPLDSTNDGIHDKDDNHPLIADVDSKELIDIVIFDQRKGKALGHDTITHKLLRSAIGTPFYIHLAKLFTFSLRIGYIPTAWKLATLCMLTKPDKLPRTH